MQSDLVFAREEYSISLIEEALPLLIEHKDEMSFITDRQLAPDWSAYYVANGSGHLRIYTARDQAGKLMGYAIYLVGRNMHYDMISATHDTLYLHPECRKGWAAKRFHEWMEYRLREEGVEIVTHNTRKKRDASVLYRRMGYEEMDVIYFKRLTR